jgi:hypothetical protein
MIQRYACTPFIIDQNLVVHDSHHLMVPCTKGNWVRYKDYDSMVEKLDLANRRLGELAHAPIMDELNEAKRELARYKTPCLDNVTINE